MLFFWSSGNKQLSIRLNPWSWTKSPHSELWTRPEQSCNLCLTAWPLCCSASCSVNMCEATSGIRSSHPKASFCVAHYQVRRILWWFLWADWFFLVQRLPNANMYNLPTTNWYLAYLKKIYSWYVTFILKNKYILNNSTTDKFSQIEHTCVEYQNIARTPEMSLVFQLLSFAPRVNHILTSRRVDAFCLVFYYINGIIYIANLVYAKALM